MVVVVLSWSEDSKFIVAVLGSGDFEVTRVVVTEV